MRSRHQASKRAALAAAGLGVLITAGCSASAGTSPYFGRTVPPAANELRYISGSEPETLDPQLGTGQPEARIQMALFDGLTEYDPRTGQPIPSLATHWEPNDDNSAFTFHLRPDARWSDGSPLTADDVVYAWRRGLDPLVASRAAFMAYDVLHGQAFNEGGVFVRDRTGAFVMDPNDPAHRLVLPGDVAQQRAALAQPALAQRGPTTVPVRAEDVGVEALDPHTLRVQLRHPVPFFPKMVAHQFFRPVPRRIVEAFGDAWTRPEHIVTSGAFHLITWRPYDALVVSKSPTFWDAASVRLDRITFYPVEDLTTMMNLYKAGEVDATFNHTVPSAWIDQMRKYRDYMDEAECATESYSFNTTKAPTNDVRVRRALNMAIDKVALAGVRRAAKPTTSAVPNGIFPDYPGVKGAPFDPAAAKALLVEAGFGDANGQFDPAKFPVSEVEITYNTSESNRSTAEFIQAQWKQHLGITAALKNMEFKTFLVTRAALEYKGIARSGWIGDYLDPFTFLSMYTTPGGDNATGWSDPVFVAKLNSANREHDVARRNAVMAEAESLFLDAQPNIPLYNNSSSWMRKPYVKGLYPNPVTMHAWKFVYIERDQAQWN